MSFSIFLIGKTTKEIEDDPFSTAITTHLIDELDFPLIIICPPERTNTQLFLTRSRKIKLFEPSEGIFIYNTKYWTTKKICKIGPLGPKEKIDFFSFFLMRKRLSSGQKWFLRPYFPLIRGMFLLKSGLRFSFWALEVPEPRVRKRPY